MADVDVQVDSERRARVEEFRRRHRTGLLTLVFTDLVGSTAFEQSLGDRAISRAHDRLPRVAAA